MDEQNHGEAKRTSFEAAVVSLAVSEGLDAREVQSLYESVLAEMKRNAIIVDFLPIFATRRVKEMLSSREAEPRPDREERGSYGQSS